MPEHRKEVTRKIFPGRTVEIKLRSIEYDLIIIGNIKGFAGITQHNVEGPIQSPETVRRGGYKTEFRYTPLSGGKSVIEFAYHKMGSSTHEREILAFARVEVTV